MTGIVKFYAMNASSDKVPLKGGNILFNYQCLHMHIFILIVLQSAYCSTIKPPRDAATFQMRQRNTKLPLIVESCLQAKSQLF